MNNFNSNKFKLNKNIYEITSSKYNWSQILNDNNCLLDDVVTEILDENTLYYYAFNDSKSIYKPQKLTSTQIKKIYEVIDGLIKNADKYDIYKTKFELIDNIDFISEDELNEKCKYYGFKIDTSQPLADRKASFVKKLKLECGYGIFGEMLFYSVNEEFFSGKLLLSKISLITAAGTYAHGSDGIFYDPDEDALIFGEAKFTENLKSGLYQALTSLMKFEETLKNDCSCICRNTRILKNGFELKFEDFDKNELNNKKKIISVFVLHGKEYDSSEIEMLLSDYYLKISKALKMEDLELRVISFPILEKYKLTNKILKELDARCKKI